MNRREKPASRDTEAHVIDADGDHVHFEMAPTNGDSLLWLTMRRGTPPERLASSLRKIAGLIERHGRQLLNRSDGELAPGPLRLDYDENGDLIPPI